MRRWLPPLALLALAILDADALATNLKAEIAHRKLPMVEERVCSIETTKRVVELLRELVGPSIAKEADVEPYARGLNRLRQELEVRAGLPRAD